MHHHLPWIAERVLAGFVFTALLCGLRACLRTLRENQRLALADGSTAVCRRESALLLPINSGGQYRV